MYLPYMKVSFKLKILRYLGVPGAVSFFPLSILYQKGLCALMCRLPAIYHTELCPHPSPQATFPGQSLILGNLAQVVSKDQ